MDTQRELFGAIREPAPVDPQVAPADVPRLSRQCRHLLGMFRTRPTWTNRELTGVCLRYGARIHDLRAAGCRFESRCVGGGTWEFTMTYSPEGLE